MGDRFRWTRRILALDPVADHEKIYRISAGYEFPWDYQRSLELALLKTYCVPSISARLGVRALMDERMLTAFGLPAAPRWVSAVASLGLRARADVVRTLLPARRRSRLGVDARNRSYPGYPAGYRPSDLGADAASH